MPAYPGSDPARALESLGRLERIKARFVLPGHGQPWTAGLPEATRLARETGLPGWGQPTGVG
jgi:glyoxylase-like metal-dependent hydrolase (beta-lactamase superfamily II)